jgi:hypothetical protein
VNVTSCSLPKLNFHLVLLSHQANFDFLASLDASKLDHFVDFLLLVNFFA